jgi:hypothetical protein
MVAKMKGMPKPKGGPDMSAPTTNGFSAFLPGMQVAVVGLKSQPQLNGRCAYVGNWDADAGRFDAWLSPMKLFFGPTGLKLNWVDAKSDKQPAVRVKPTNMQPLNMRSDPNGPDFERLPPPQKVAVLRAQQQLWDESTLFKGPKPCPPNLVGLFRNEHPGGIVTLVRHPQRGVVPDDVLSEQGSGAIVVRRQLDPGFDGVEGYIYVVASCPTIKMSYRVSCDGDGGAAESKGAADGFMAMMRSFGL